MKTVRTRSTVIATLLLVALALSGVLADNHGHEGPALALDHPDLPSFEADHSRPDRTLHIESSSPVVASTCVACLQRHGPRAAFSLRSVFGGAELGALAAPADPSEPAASGHHRLPASRAPPRA